MRTTLNLRDEALKLAKRRGEETGKSLGDVVSEAVMAAYGQRPGKPPAAAIELPASGRGGLQAGVDLDDTATLLDRMDERG